MQVAHWADVNRAIRVKPEDAELQAIARGCRFSAALIRLPRRTWRVVLTPRAWAELVLAATGGRP